MDCNPITDSNRLRKGKKKKENPRKKINNLSWKKNALLSFALNVFKLNHKMSFLSLPRTLLSSFFRPSSSSSSSSMIISHSSIFSNSFSTSSINQLMRKPTHQKLKTHKGAAKRWLAIGNGNFKRVSIVTFMQNRRTW